MLSVSYCKRKRQKKKNSSMITIQLPEPRPMEKLNRNHKPILRKPPRGKVSQRKRAKTKSHRNRRCAFEETPIGYLISHECPIEWQFIMDVKQAKGLAITPDFIENFCYMTDNPVFKTEKYRRALIDFRKYGFYTPNLIEFNLNDELRRIRDRLTHRKGLEQ